jgi:dihydroneopterin aldolase
MKIYIENFEFETIIGILDFERNTSQKVEINLNLEYEFKQNMFINYVEIRDLIKKSMNEEKYFLIEEAINDISKKIKTEFPNINKLYLKISKPEILSDAKVSVSEKFIF